MKTSLKIALTSTFILATGLTLVNAEPARAGQIIGSVTQTYTTGASYDDLDWSNQFQINKFDRMGGQRVLESVFFSLSGYIRGSVLYENTARSMTTVTTNLTGTISLGDPTKPADPNDPDSIGGTLIQTVPLYRKVDRNIPRYDGVLDYGGNSGRSYSNLQATKTTSATYTAANGASFSQFIRTNSNKLTLTLDANGESIVTGGGNLRSIIDSFARADLTVTYNYSKGVPEPGVIGGVVLGIGFLGYARRRILANGNKVDK